MELLAVILLVIALGILARVYFVNSQKRAETETDRMMKKLLEENLDPEPAPAPKPEKEKQPPLSARVERFLTKADFLHREDGQAFLDHIEERLILSGQEDITPERWLARSLVIWVIGVVIPVLLWAIGFLPALLCVPVILFFALYPPLKLRQQVAERQDDIRREIPFFIQQLYMTLSSGMTVLDDAILRVAKASEEDPYDNILAREFARAQTEYRLGGVDREVALRGVSRRTQVTAVENLVEAIVQGLRTGADMSYVLGEYARQGRRMWVQDMRTFKAKKEPLVTLGVVITMFGALILFGGALLLRIFNLLGGLG